MLDRQPYIICHGNWLAILNARSLPSISSQGIPLQRLGKEDDMAGVCLYWSSKAGSLWLAASFKCRQWTNRGLTNPSVVVRFVTKLTLLITRCRRTQRSTIATTTASTMTTTNNNHHHHHHPLGSHRHHHPQQQQEQQHNQILHNRDNYGCKTLVLLQMAAVEVHQHRQQSVTGYSSCHGGSWRSIVSSLTRPKLPI